MNLTQKYTLVEQLRIAEELLNMAKCELIDNKPNSCIQLLKKTSQEMNKTARTIKAQENS